MHEILKRWWNNGEDISEHGQSLELTVTRLMVSMMKADNHVDEAEHDEVIRLLGKRFGIDNVAAEDLFQEALQSSGNAPRFEQLAQQLKDNYDPQEVAMLLGDIWAVAEADGQIDYFEDRYISRLSSLLGVSPEMLTKARGRKAA